MIENPLLHISDKKHFPVLSAGGDVPCQTLMCCDDLTFMAPAEMFQAYAVIGKDGNDWHLYGDTRWPTQSVWVEFPFSSGFSGACGALVLKAEIPDDEVDIFNWVANNAPLQQILPAERSESVIKQKLEIMRTQSVSTEHVPGPNDQKPKFVHNYCIHHCKAKGVPRFVAHYTDLLNADGIPIPRYRMANVSGDDVFMCRFALHALFHLNEARIAGMKFLTVGQIQTFEPTFLLPEQKNPKWAQFHPCRTLRTRPALRAIPSPTDVREGVISFDEFQHALDVRQQELMWHMLAYARLARLTVNANALYQEDADSSITAFVHRTNGGAIYVLPDRLVEEFDNTECSEVRVQDIALPFPTVFLKFTPPQPLFLGDGALVDGCYFAKQGEEFLLILTSCLDGVDYQRSLSVACLDPTFSLHLRANESDLCVNDAVERGVQAFLARNAPPEDNRSTTIERPDGTVTHIEDVRAKSRKRRIEVFRSQEPTFRACLNIVVNAACFISFRPNDITDGWEGEPPSDLVEASNDPGITRRKRDKKQDAIKRIENGDFTRIKICGRDLFSDESEHAETGHKGSPRAHWRRGHWRRQRHGPGLVLVVLRWIRPTLVKKDAGSLVENRIYDVGESKS